MNEYDKYINDDLMCRIYKNKLEEIEKDNHFDNIFCNDYNPKNVYTTCAVNETKINDKELEKVLAILQNKIEVKRYFSYWEYFHEPVLTMNIFP